MKHTRWLSVPILSLGLAAVAATQPKAPRIITCDPTVASPLPLRVQDEASGRGALVEDIALITLPNGMKSVQFSVRNAGQPNPYGTILKLRYTVQWTDDCGRRISNGTQAVDGLALDPQRQQLVQSTAMDPDATHAFLRIYVEN